MRWLVRSICAVVAYLVCACSGSNIDGVWTIPSCEMEMEQAENVSACGTLTLIPSVGDESHGQAEFKVLASIDLPTPTDISIDGDREFVQSIRAVAEIKGAYELTDNTMEIDFDGDTYIVTIQPEWVTFDPLFSSAAYAQKRDSVLPMVVNRYTNLARRTILEGMLRRYEKITSLKVDKSRLTGDASGEEVVLVRNQGK